MYERSRRATKHHSHNLRFLAEDKECGVAQEDFLSNAENKNLLINQLIDIFNKAGIQTSQAEEDADFLIVDTAIKKNKVL